MNLKKLESAIHEAYKELYNNSEPKADFDELVKNGKKNERGEIEIPFMDYEIDESKYDEIITSIVKKYKIKGWYKRAFEVHIALGCSPKIKKKC